MYAIQIMYEVLCLSLQIKVDYNKNLINYNILNTVPLSSAMGSTSITSAFPSSVPPFKLISVFCYLLDNIHFRHHG